LACASRASGFKVVGRHGMIVLGKYAADRGDVFGFVESFGGWDTAGLEGQRDAIGNPPPEVDPIGPCRFQRPAPAFGVDGVAVNVVSGIGPCLPQLARVVELDQIGR
jgi:hypothetical protein